MPGLEICVKLEIYVAHMFYACSFRHNTAFTFAKIEKNLSFDAYTTVFAWGSVT